MKQTPLQLREEVVRQFQLSKQSPMKTLVAIAAAAVMLPSISALGLEIDLTGAGDTSLHAVPGDVGGGALVQNFTSHPSGTGVFDPFLTLERNASGGNPVGIESAYNTDGHSALYLDQQRPEWNTRLTLGDLAVINVNGGSYYAFELDANEPGADKSLLSIDNIRIYTGPDNTGAVMNNESSLNSLGTLKWSMNDPLKNGSLYKVNTWIKLDANLSDQLKKANGGSGYSDMIIYIPTSAFAGALLTDNVWFYNLNGVHYSADYDPNDVNLGAEAGYEEWRAAFGPNAVPDGGGTLILLGSALTALFGYRRFATAS